MTRRTFLLWSMPLALLTTPGHELFSKRAGRPAGSGRTPHIRGVAPKAGRKRITIPTQGRQSKPAMRGVKKGGRK